MLKASQWKPAKVMNCQQKPNLAKSQMKDSICASVMPAPGRALLLRASISFSELNWKEGKRANSSLSFTALPPSSGVSSLLLRKTPYCLHHGAETGAPTVPVEGWAQVVGQHLMWHRSPNLLDFLQTGRISFVFILDSSIHLPKNMIYWMKPIQPLFT